MPCFVENHGDYPQNIVRLYLQAEDVEEGGVAMTAVDRKKGNLNVTEAGNTTQ
jgi:hypothetical protein